VESSQQPIAIAVAIKKMNNSLTTRTDARNAKDRSNPKITDWDKDLPPLASTVLN
jgi:hypothetical protein